MPDYQAPANLNLLTLKQLNSSHVLVRLEHIFQKDEHLNLSTPITVDLAQLLPMFDISNVTMMKLAANVYESYIQGNDKK